MNSKLLICSLGVAVAAINGVQAQSSSASSPGTPSVLPRPDFHFPGNVGRTFQDSDPPQFPQPVQAPKGAPNVLLILIDDVGFGQFSTFGGGVPSPTMDKLAAEGLRYNKLHTSTVQRQARCPQGVRSHHRSEGGIPGNCAAELVERGASNEDCSRLREKLEKVSAHRAWHTGPIHATWLTITRERKP